MHKLIEYVCGELEELEKKASKSGALSMSEIEYADKLAHLKKNLLKSDELYDEAMGGDMSADYSGNYMNTGRGRSYAGAGRGGSYANMGGSSYAQRRDRFGRYSSDRGYSRDMTGLADRLRDLMEDAPDESMRRDIERLLQKVEQAQ